MTTNGNMNTHRKTANIVKYGWVVYLLLGLLWLVVGLTQVPEALVHQSDWRQPHGEPGPLFSPPVASKGNC